MPVFSSPRTISLRSVIAWASLTVTSAAMADELADFQQSHTYKTLRYQEKITDYLPFYKSEKLRTHNSFNTQDYRVDGIEYIDPQQDYTLTGQLDAGVRQLNLDVHNVDGTLRLCHFSASDNHLLCSKNDRLFKDGMNEIVTWLRQPEHRDEVVIVEFQDEMDGKYAQALDVLDNFSDIIMKPNNCGEAFPQALTRNDILATGKQLVMSIGGGHCGSSDSARRQYGALGFSQSTPSGGAGGLSGAVWDKNYSAYPTCVIGGNGPDRLQVKKSWVSEDRTNIALIAFPERRVSGEQVRLLTDCGVGFQFDSLDAHDGRLKDVIWSWANGEPNNSGGNENCAQVTTNWGLGNRINDSKCSNIAPFACRDTDNGSWLLTSQKGQWQQGFNACAEEFGDGVIYSMPKDGYQMRTLQDEKNDANYSTVWIAYTDAHQEGNWEPADNATVYWQQGFAKSRWNSGEPNDWGSGEDCAMVRSDGRLNDAGCNNNYPAVCKDSNGQWLMTSAVQWKQAQAACSNAGANFFMPETQAEFGEMQAQVGGTNAWLNYNDIAKEGQWLANVALASKQGSVAIDNGFYRLKNDEHYCLDVEGGDSKVQKGRDVEQYSCHGDRNKKSQLWRHYSDGTIRPYLNTGLCLDAAGGGTSEGTDIMLWSCHGGSNQKWLNGSYNSLRSAKAANMTISISLEKFGKGRDAQLEVFNHKADKRWFWDYD